MKLNQIDLNKLNVFITIMEKGSLARAAEELMLSRSALSQSLSSFEGSLKLILFRRVGRKLVPTTSGEKLYRSVKLYQEQLKQAFTEVNTSENAKRSQLHLNPLRIGAYFEFAKHKLAPVLASFTSQYSEIHLRFLFDSPTRLDKLLQQDRIDCALSIRPPTKKRGIVSFKLYKEQLVLIAPPHLLALKNLEENLKSTPIIDYYPGHTLFPQWWKLHFKKNLTKHKIKHYVASAEVLASFVSLGMGVGVVPRYVCEGRSTKELEIIEPSSRVLHDYIWLILPETWEQNQSLKLFVEWARGAF